MSGPRLTAAQWRLLDTLPFEGWLPLTSQEARSAKALAREGLAEHRQVLLRHKARATPAGRAALAAHEGSAAK